MGGVEDGSWIDMMMDEFGSAFTKADETIQKSIELMKEFTKEIFDEEPIQDSTRQLNNGKSGGEEHSSSLEKPVPHEVKENPIQQEEEEDENRVSKPSLEIFDEESTQDSNRQLNNGKSGAEHSSSLEKPVSEVKENPIQQEEEEEENTVSKPSLEIFDEEPTQDSNRQLNNGKSGEENSSSLGKLVADEVKENPIQQEEEEDENTVSKSSENMSKLSWGSISRSYNHRDIEEYIDSTLKWNNGYELLKDTDTSSKEEEGEITVSESRETMLELNLGACPSHHNEEDSGLILKWRGDFELLNDYADTSHGKDYELCKDDDDEVEECNSEVMVEVLWKIRKCGSSRESLVVHDDEDSVSDKLEGFVDVRHVEIANSSEFSEDPEFDWVFVTSD